MSGFGHFELSTTITSDSKHYNMKQFITAVREYLVARTEDTANIINRHLQLLSVTIDLSVFDPHTSVSAEFFVSLHELLSNLEPRSGISWCCVYVLKVACRNSSARNALIHTYQFLPPLSRLLSDQLTMEKKIRLLSVMQELSCGIKISWQIPHLPHLMSTLTRWVGNEQEEIVALALGVLVNLCYKNLPAIYTLSRCLDIKKFMKTIMPLQGMKIEVHVCKLCIILENMYGKVPEESLIKLIEVTFKSIVEAFKARDSILLRHIVEFFLDIKLTSTQQNIILQFDKYDTEVDKLLTAIESDSDGGDVSEQYSECMALILEFIHSLIELNLPCLLIFHERIIKVSLKWIQIELVCSQALLMLRTIAVSSNCNKNSLLEPLLSGLPIFLITLEHTEEEIPTHLEYNKRMSALMELLRALVQVDSLRDRVLCVLKEQHLYKIFMPLIGNTSPRNRASGADTYSNEAVNLYVNAIGLVDELAKYSDPWKNVHVNLLQQKQMHMILAQALFCGPKNIKTLILELVTSPRFPREDVAVAMNELQPLVQVEPRNDGISQQMADNLCFPNMSVAQSEKLDEIMNKVKTAVAQNNLFNISTSDVMELYEYKLASMGHAERAAVASMEAASQRCTHLQHRTAQLTAELSRLHQLLFHTQQCCEEVTKGRDLLGEKFRELSNRLEAEKGRTVVLTSQLSGREKAFQEIKILFDETNIKLRETETARNQLDEQYTNLKKFVADLQEKLVMKEKAFDKKEELLIRANSTIDHLKSNNLQLESHLNQLETELRLKCKELAEVTQELMSKKQIIDTITKLTHSQIK